MHAKKIANDILREGSSYKEIESVIEHLINESKLNRREQFLLLGKVADLLKFEYVRFWTTADVFYNMRNYYGETALSEEDAADILYCCGEYLENCSTENGHEMIQEKISEFLEDNPDLIKD